MTTREWLWLAALTLAAVDAAYWWRRARKERRDRDDWMLACRAATKRADKAERILQGFGLWPYAEEQQALRENAQRRAMN